MGVGHAHREVVALQQNYIVSKYLAMNKESDGVCGPDGNYLHHLSA